MPAPGTELQARFAIAYARNCGDSTRAAVEAGYSEQSAQDLGYRALQAPIVQEMIMAELAWQRALAGAIGLHALVQVAQNDKSPAPAKVAAGRALMEFSGLVGSTKFDPDMPSRGTPTPDYKAILDSFATRSRVAVAAGGTIQ